MKIITTKTQEFSYDNDRILKVKYFKNSQNLSSYASEKMEIVKQLTKGERHFVLIDTRANNNSLKQFRSFSTNQEASNKQIAHAYIVATKTNKVIGNVLLSIKKPTIPTRLFSNESEAIKWFNNMIYLSETNNFRIINKAYA